MILPSEALLLVGGLGTRLGALTQAVPKPMLPVKGKPFLERTLCWLKGFGIKRFVLATAYKSKVIQDYFANGARWEVEIVYSDPDGKQMGTGGSIKEAQRLLHGSDFFALNGDVRFDISLSKLFSFHALKKAIATLALAHVARPDRYGRVVLTAEGRIEAFLEKGNNPALDGSEGSLINGGIYVFNRKIFEFIPAGIHASLEQDIFPRLAGADLWGFYFPNAYFLDIGTLQDYELAIQKEF